jgi:hypothetical protein
MTTLKFRYLRTVSFGLAKRVVACVARAERRKEDAPVRLAGAQERGIETLVAAVVVFESHGLRTEVVTHPQG